MLMHNRERNELLAKRAEVAALLNTWMAQGLIFVLDRPAREVRFRFPDDDSTTGVFRFKLREDYGDDSSARME